MIALCCLDSFNIQYDMQDVISSNGDFASCFFIK